MYESIHVGTYSFRWWGRYYRPPGQHPTVFPFTVPTPYRNIGAGLTAQHARGQHPNIGAGPFLQHRTIYFVLRYMWEIGWGAGLTAQYANILQFILV